MLLVFNFSFSLIIFLSAYLPLYHLQAKKYTLFLRGIEFFNLFISADSFLPQAYPRTAPHSRAGAGISNVAGPARSAVRGIAHSDSARCIARLPQGRVFIRLRTVSLVDSTGLRHRMLLTQAEVA